MSESLPSRQCGSDASELERLRAECCVCEKCGHVQAEPNWCQVCGGRTKWPDWAKRSDALTNAALDREEALRHRLESLSGAIRQALEDHGELAE
jgi:hypothetical protein